MTQYRFPSSDFPPLPNLAVEAPKGWFPAIVPQTTLALAAEEVPDRFRANVVVTVSRHRAGFTLAKAEEQLRAATEGLPQADVVGLKTVEVDGVARLVHEVSFAHPEAGTLLQSHVMLLVEGAATSDLVHAIGTCAGDRVQEDLAEIRHCLMSLTANHG